MLLQQHALFYYAKKKIKFKQCKNHLQKVEHLHLIKMSVWQCGQLVEVKSSAHKINSGIHEVNLQGL